MLLMIIGTYYEYKAKAIGAGSEGTHTLTLVILTMMIVR